MFTEPVAVNGSCTHFVRQVSATPIIVDPVAVADAPYEWALIICIRIYLSIGTDCLVIRAAVTILDTTLVTETNVCDVRTSAMSYTGCHCGGWLWNRKLCVTRAKISQLLLSTFYRMISSELKSILYFRHFEWNLAIQSRIRVHFEALFEINK